MRRRWYLLAVVVVAAFGVCVRLLTSPGPGATWANVDRITPGMTRAEAEAVIGQPPQARWPGSERATGHSPDDYHAALLWSSTECDILVYLDRTGRVIRCVGVGNRPPPWYDRLRQRLGW